MNLSQRAIALCRMKYGKGELLGFENVNYDILNNLTEEDEEAVIRELAEAELLESTDEIIHLGALAHHMLNMMIEPEQLIRIDNDKDDVAVSVYIRNTFYLCVIDNKKLTHTGDPQKYTIELLPRVDLIVGAFTYALGKDNENDPKSDCRGLKIAGTAWDKDRNITAEISLTGEEDDFSDISSVINTITMWMLDNLAAAVQPDIYIEEQAEDTSEEEVTK